MIDLQTSVLMYYPIAIGHFAVGASVVVLLPAEDQRKRHTPVVLTHESLLNFILQ